MDQRVNTQVPLDCPTPPSPKTSSWAGSLCTVLTKGLVHHVAHPMMIVAGIMSRCHPEPSSPAERGSIGNGNSIILPFESGRSDESTVHTNDDDDDDDDVKKTSRSFPPNKRRGLKEDESVKSERLGAHQTIPPPLREVIVFTLDWDDRNFDDVISILSDDDDAFDTSFCNALDESKTAIYLTTLCASNDKSFPGHEPI